MTPTNSTLPTFSDILASVKAQNLHGCRMTIRNHKSYTPTSCAGCERIAQAIQVKMVETLRWASSQIPRMQIRYAGQDIIRLLDEAADALKKETK